MKTLRTVADLHAAGLLPAGAAPELERVPARYAVAITPDMADLIDRANPADPIARQFVPDPSEHRAVHLVGTGEDLDPLAGQLGQPHRAEHVGVGRRHQRGR